MSLGERRLLEGRFVMLLVPLQFSSQKPPATTLTHLTVSHVERLAHHEPCRTTRVRHTGLQIRPGVKRAWVHHAQTGLPLVCAKGQWCSESFLEVPPNTLKEPSWRHAKGTIVHSVSRTERRLPELFLFKARFALIGGCGSLRHCDRLGLWDPCVNTPRGFWNSSATQWGMRWWLSGPFSGPLVPLERRGCPVRAPSCPVDFENSGSEGGKGGWRQTRAKGTRRIKKKNRVPVSVCWRTAGGGGSWSRRLQRYFGKCALG